MLGGAFPQKPLSPPPACSQTGATPCQKTLYVIENWPALHLARKATAAPPIRCRLMGNCLETTYDV